MLKSRWFWIALAIISLIGVMATDDVLAPGLPQLAGVYATMLMLGASLVGVFWPRRYDH